MFDTITHNKLPPQNDNNIPIEKQCHNVKVLNEKVD